MKVLFFLVMASSVMHNSFSQGCVVIRNIAGFGQFAQLGYDQSDKKWMINISNRYFKSVQPFKDAQQLDLNPDETKRNINYNYTLNLSMIRLLENGWAIGMDLPISNNTLVSRQEHYSGDRHSTHSFGIGDIRLTVYKWFRNQSVSQKWNVQGGIGIKLPTGEYRYEDYFYNNPVDKTAKESEPVDPSLQLGDGGTGITAELNGYYIVGSNFSIYGNAFYLINPRDQNGVSTLKGHPAGGPDYNGAYDEAATLTVNSVPDNYTVRFGGNFTYKQLVGTAGLRFEGVPRFDLVGENHGLRRPGRVSSVEVGCQYKFKSGFFYVFVPIAFNRWLMQSVPDKEQSELQGKYQTTIGRIPGSTILIGYSFLL